MPVLFDIRHLMEGDVQDLTNSVGILTVFFCGAHPTFIEWVPILHKYSRYIVAFTPNRQKEQSKLQYHQQEIYVSCLYLYFFQVNLVSIYH